jgi:hypothetical protein
LTSRMRGFVSDEVEVSCERENTIFSLGGCRKVEGDSGDGPVGLLADKVAFRVFERCESIDVNVS